MLIQLLLVGLGPWRCWTADNPRAPYSSGRDVNQTHPVTTVYQFPPGIWVENLAVRRNGLILAVSVTSPLLYQLDPDSSPSAERPTVLYDFSAGGTGIQGIVEVRNDIFAVQVTTCNITALTCTRGSHNVWEVDLHGYDRRGGGDVKVRKVADFPSSLQLNGMATLNSDPSGSQVLIADSLLGAVWRLNMRTGENSVAIRDESMVGTATDPVGVNGLQIRADRLWFTNSGKGTLNAVAIDPVTGEKRGDVKVVTVGLTPDDFELGEERDEAFVANGPSDQLLAVGPLRGGAATTLKVIAELAGPTSVRWGRSRIDKARRSLYASTSGGLAQWIAGNVTVGGSVSRIDLKDDLRWPVAYSFVWR